MLSRFDRLRKSLKKTKDNLIGKIAQVVSRRKIDDDLLEEIEEILIEADVGVKATMRLIETLQTKAKEQKLTDGDELIGLLREEISRILSTDQRPPFADDDKKPVVWLIIGVNGAGKTTTIGKLACLLAAEGKKVMIGACDTFRAAAIDQIAIWAERSGVDLIRSQPGADPASVAFDAATAAKARGADVLLLDTAGRLHTKTHLMDELVKIRKVVDKALPDTPVYSKLVLDGTTGQNAISQVSVFTEAVGCDGLIITKLDGTAKGGVLIALAEEFGVAVDYVGLGEGIEDIQQFDAKQFAEALFTS